MRDETPFHVVLDTNVFVGAYLSRSETSPNREILNRWLDDQFVLLYSLDTLREVIGTLKEKRIEQSLIVELVARVTILGERVAVPFVESILPENPEDNLILACAIHGRATHLITYDAHFYEVKTRFPFSVLEPLPFLFELRSALET
jgi:putative PIN family toxin of toxin-antitoxin system